ncbi:unnamed protein product [Clonostachys rosea f. rosea IK726]|uniref:Uncharacterized protein n=1 Tax=Clonostachys rosea f. rosea IK726 TaxID=1349383 RepID=A0ACA9UBA7_BIOOC|nr:unnamed protein product [Clonostachys rosea f. rosea IK726]
MSPLTRLPGSLASLKLNWTTALVVSVCVVDSVTIAYDGSLMGSLNVMETYHNYFQLTTTTTAINTCATFLGAILVGPKSGLWAAVAINILGAVLAGSAINVAMFIAARIVIGVGVGLGQTAASTYVAETTAPRIRSFALGLYFSCWAVGALLAAGVSYGCSTLEPSNASWRIPSYLQGAMPLLIVPLLYYIPESPRWLAFRDRREEARLLHRSTTEKAQSMSLKAIVRKPNRRRLLLALSVAPLAMLTGSNVITYYFGSMLTQAGIGNPTTQLQINVVLSSWQLVVAITGSSLAEKLGRRFLALFSLGTCSAFFYILAGLTAKYGTAGDKAGTYGTVACIFLFLGAYAFGITPLTAMYAPRGPVVQHARQWNRDAGILIKSCGVLVTLAFPYMLESIGWKSYIINASWNILLWLYIWFQWVETKDSHLKR